jgi:4-diphosphocytidyl-2-C-methyl-D-erythritol kinase
VSTAEAYRGLAASRAAAAPPEATAIPVPDAWDGVDAAAANDFEPIIAAQHPEVAEALRALRGAGASMAMLTGSGSSCFGRFADSDASRAAAASLHTRLACRCEAVTTLTSFPVVRLA